MTGLAWLTQLLEVLAAVALAPLLLGWVNQCRAWLQNRKAPSLLLPYRGIRKLFHKDAVLAEGASPLFRAAPYVVFGAMVAAASIIPSMGTGLPFASTERTTYEGRDVGVMHACGHDAHVAILMGAASVLAGMRESIPGTIKFIFQPAEEGAPQGEEGGAGMMVAAGVLQNPAVDAIFGLHVSQTDAAGEASYRPRGALASAQRFDITVHGRQTHGAQPWSGVDPIVAAAQIVTALQTIVSRTVDVTRAPAVVTVGTFHAGVRDNIVPDVAKLSGTIRTFDPAMKEAIHADVKRIATSVAEALGATADVEIEAGVPVTYNDAALTEAMLPTLRAVYGAQNVRLAELITGAEDFSFYQEKIPGLFFFVGVRPKEVPAANGVPNHSPLFDTDEAALPQAVEVMSRMAVDYLERHARVAAGSDP